MSKDEQKCKYITDSICVGTMPEDPGSCLECIASGLNNHLLLIRRFMEYVTIPFEAAVHLANIFDSSVQTHRGYVKWLLAHTKNETSRASLLEQIERVKQEKAEAMFLIGLSRKDPSLEDKR